MASSGHIVYFLTTGVLLPPIVIFSLLLCGLASLDSNLPFFFLLFAVCLFASSLLLSCAYLPTISRQADKSKDEIMTEVLRVFAGLDVKAVQVALEVVRVTFASP